MRILLIIPFLMILSGCLNPSQRVNEAPTITNPQPPSINTDKLELEMHKQKEYIRESQNAMQQNLNGQISVGVNKLGEEVNVVKANVDSVLKFNTQFDTQIKEFKIQLSNNIELNATLQSQIKDVSIKLQNQIELNNDIRIQLKNQIDLTNQMQATIKDISANIDISGLAGVGNKIEKKVDEMRQDFKAGGDIINNQFTKEVLEAYKSADKTIFTTNLLYAIIFIVLILTVAISVVIILLRDRRTFKQERDENHQRSNFYQQNLMRALAKLPEKDGSEICKALDTT